MDLYYTHALMKSHLKKLKRINPVARVMGLDLGRKYIGIAISDKQLKFGSVIIIHIPNIFIIAIRYIYDRSLILQAI
jgi:hypothetical protein